MSAVSAEGVFFCFDDGNPKPALDNLNMHVEQGEIYGLLGPSGCGKTTLLKCIANQYRPSSGTIRIFGKKPGHQDLHIPGHHVGFMPQEIVLMPQVTVEELMIYFGRLYQMEYSDITERISFLINFLEILDKNALNCSLSGGQQRCVSLAVALIHSPPLLVLDEPTVGIDPILRSKIWNYLHILAENDKMTIMITTHYIEEAREAHTVGLMRDGRLLVEMNPSALMQRHGVFTLEEVFVDLCVSRVPYGQVAGESTSQECDHDLLDEPRTSNDVIVDEDNDLNAQSDLFKAESRAEGQWKGKVVHLVAVMTLIFNSFKRNLILILIQLIIPVLIISVNSLSARKNVHHLNVAVVNMDNSGSGMADRFLNFVDDETIIQKHYSNLDDALSCVRAGKAWGALYINPNFSVSLIDRYKMGEYVSNETIDSSTIRLYLDFTSKEIARSIYFYFDTALMNFRRKLLSNVFANPELSKSFIVTQQAWNTDATFSDCMISTMLFLNIYVNEAGMSAMILHQQKTNGILGRSLSAGVPLWLYLSANVLVVLLIQIAQYLLSIPLAILLLGTPCLGTYLSVALATLLFGLQGISNGVFLALFFNDISTAAMVIVWSMYPLTSLCGILTTKEALPYYFRWFSDYLPLTLIVNSLKTLMFRGDSLADSDVWRGLLSALVWTVVMFALSARVFRRKR